ncbi:MAG: LysM peptidoglycan-binding domain-containing protein [Bdellovibrionales bacterium]|nr:LysM peptidoglycan-binding domain-containing protein [Bdellovibrionales bacterium]
MIRSLFLALSLPILILTAVYLIERPGLEHPFGKATDAKTEAVDVEDLKTASVRKKTKKRQEERAETVIEKKAETPAPVLSDAQYETKVEDAGETLSLISMRLYGTSKRWKEIAETNGMQPPYAVKVGQVLRLTSAPTLDEFQGRIEILKHYRKKFGLALEGADYDRAVQTMAKSYGKTVPVRRIASTAPVVKTPEIKPEAVLPVAKAEIQTEPKKADLDEEKRKVDEAFEKEGLTYLKEKKWKNAIAHFAKRKDGFLKAPNDNEVIWYSGSLAEVVFQRLNLRKEIEGRNPAEAKKERGAIHGWVAEWSDHLVCFNVPTGEKRKDGFGYRCIGVKSAKN